MYTQDEQQREKSIQFVKQGTLLASISFSNVRLNTCFSCNSIPAEEEKTERRVKCVPEREPFLMHLHNSGVVGLSGLLWRGQGGGMLQGCTSWQNWSRKVPLVLVETVSRDKGKDQHFPTTVATWPTGNKMFCALFEFVNSLFQQQHFLNCTLFTLKTYRYYEFPIRQRKQYLP